MRCRRRSSVPGGWNSVAVLRGCRSRCRLRVRGRLRVRTGGLRGGLVILLGGLVILWGGLVILCRGGGRLGFRIGGPGGRLRNLGAGCVAIAREWPVLFASPVGSGGSFAPWVSKRTRRESLPLVKYAVNV